MYAHISYGHRILTKSYKLNVMTPAHTHTSTHITEFIGLLKEF